MTLVLRGNLKGFSKVQKHETSQGNEMIVIGIGFHTENSGENPSPYIKNICKKGEEIINNFLHTY